MRNYVQQKNSKNSTRSNAPLASTSPEGENAKGESQVIAIPNRSRDMREIKKRSRNAGIVNEAGHEALKNEDLNKGRSRGCPFMDVGYEELLIRSNFEGIPVLVNPVTVEGDGRPWFYPICEASDHTSLCSLLHIGSILRDKMSGLTEPSVETLQYTGETVRKVMETLQSGKETVPQSVVLAVGGLASGSVINAEWSQAKAHFEALKRIVEMRGGICTLDFELRKLITWGSYHVATALQQKPIFPCPTSPEARPFPLAMVDESSLRAWRTLKKLPKDSSFLYEIIFRMHQIGLSYDAEWQLQIDRAMVNNVYFELQHIILTMLFDKSWPQLTVAKYPEILALYNAFLMASQVFMWASIRHVRYYDKTRDAKIKTGSSGLLFGRVKAALNLDNTYGIWTKGKQLDALLWILFICIESCHLMAVERSWFLSEIRKVLGLLKVAKKEEFTKQLAAFPLTHELHNAAEGLWREITSALY